MAKLEQPVLLNRLFLVMGFSIWVGALVFKAWAIPRLSFHWDEFWFLHQVHMGHRGELPGSFQVFHALVFSWLPGMGSEVEQLRLARWVAWGGLALSSVLIYLLSRRWVSPSAALAAPVAFLSCWVTMAHGASFRTDSMVLPLLMGTALLLSGPSKPFHALLGAGALWGAAILFTVKSVFFAPVALAVLLCAGWPGHRKTIGWVASVGLGALLSMGFFTGLMAIFFRYAPQNAAFGTPEGAAAKMFAQWWPQLPVAQWVVLQDPLVWSLVIVGAIVAWSSRRPLVGLLLSLLPVMFYRNAFDYYYLVMMAPLMVLVAFALHWLLSRHWKARINLWGALLVMLGLYSGAAYNAVRLQSAFKQENQRIVLEQVHRIFPAGTRYLDHSGTLVGFEKVNGFLSSWGVENYRASGKAIVPELMKGKPVPLLFSDREVLAPGGVMHGRLLPEDQRRIAASYVHHWGPLWVLGTSLPKDRQKVWLAWPGKYRLLSDESVWLDGEEIHPGEVFEKTSQSHVPVNVRWGKSSDKASLVWADVPPPPEFPAPSSFFVVPR